MLLRALVIVGSAVLFFGCTSSSPASKKVKSVQYCVPKASLESSNIVNGTEVSIQDPDAEQAVMILKRSETGMTLCTASAISRNVLLTAAHCIDATAENTLAVFHNSITCESGFDSRSHSIKVSEVVKHPSFNGDLSTDDYSSNDIALVFLKDNIPSHYKIHNIASPIEAKDKDIQFLGYGTTSFGKDDSLSLRKTSLPSTAIKINEGKKWIEVDQSHGTGICTGDSGGPGLVQIDGETKVLSVNSTVQFNSFENEEQRCNRWAVLTLVHPHLNWIESELNSRLQILGK